MKTSKIFMVAAIALGLMACNKNEDINVPQDEAQATLSVKINSGTLRALGTPGEADKVTKLEVYVYKGGTLEAYKKAEEAAGVTEVKQIAVTAGASKLVVVANSAEDLGEVEALSALEEKMVEGLVAPASIVMTSEVTPIDIKAGHNVYGYTKSGDENQISEAPLALVRVPARVVLDKAEVAFEGVFADWKFTPEQVFVFNVRGKSKLFGENLYVSEAPFYSGVVVTGFGGALDGDSSVEKTSLQDVLETKDFSKLPAYYYTYENEDADHPVVLTIKGKLQRGDNSIPGAPYTDAAGTTYYSILVNVAKPGYVFTGVNSGNGKVKRNTEYKLDVTIKRPGKDDPTVIPSDPATLDVKVVVTPWSVVNQNVTY